MIRYPRESVFSILKFEYLSENQTKIENILSNWSVAQDGSNGEKDWRSKISLDCPFKELYEFFQLYKFFYLLFSLVCKSCVRKPATQKRKWKDWFLLTTLFSVIIQYQDLHITKILRLVSVVV